MTAGELKNMLVQAVPDWNTVQEIRIRTGRPVFLYINGKEHMLEKVTADAGLVKEILNIISHHSLYAFEDEIRQGFLTIEGGHRIGVSGKAVLEGREIRTIKDISGLNIRLAHQRIGCADQVMPWLYKDGKLQNTLFISPPGAGKTTMLRDVIRQVSDGNPYGSGQTVSVVDERSEIGACVRGVPQCELGVRTDVMDRCPKVQGMLMMLRSMAPQVMAVDEIGTREDLNALFDVMKCGCRILATVHGDSVDDVRKKKVLNEMMDGGMFARYVVLSGVPHPGILDGVYNEEGQQIAGREERMT